MSAQEQLNDLVNRFYDDYFSYNPTEGRYAGFHRYLGKIPDFSYENIMGFLKRLRFYELEAERLGEENLSLQDSADLAQLTQAVKYERFGLLQLRWWAEDPMAYEFHLDVSTYLKRNYDTITVRAQHTADHLKAIPHFLDQQKFNLQSPLPKINLTTTIEMYKGYRDFYREDVIQYFSEIEEDSILLDLEQSVIRATKALDIFIKYMEEILLPESTDTFAIGRFNYIDMLRHGERVEIELDKLLRIGEEDLSRNSLMFEELAQEFMPGKSVQEVMAEVAKDHPQADSLISDTEEMLEAIRDFIIEKDLVTIPSEVRINVEETPSFYRWAFAMCDTPGPYEKSATESFYYVTNVLDEWPDKKKEEWLTKFDYATLDGVSVHEAYPGHYVHYLHTLSAPSKVSKLAGAYSFWEGWAHYSEEMMLDEGWHEGEARYRLAQLSEALLRDCRFICSIKMHTQKMTVEEAKDFLMENALMAETPAQKEAERGTFDPGYLNYTLGKLMILKLREDWKAQEGDAFSVKRFHDTLLSFGAPPVPLVRQLMLTDDDGKIL
jgi:uncharacterized protein (DUF885 family)